MSNADRVASHELKLFIDNDGQLYERTAVPIRRNLMAKRAQGKYAHKRAVDAFMYLVEAGAKKYNQEFSSGTPWHALFPLATRRATAEELARSFETMAGTGELDYLLAPSERRRAAAPVAAKSRSRIEQEIDEALAEGRRVQIVRSGGSSYFRPGQYGYVVGSTNRGGMATLDEGTSRAGDVAYLISKKKKGEGGGAVWFSRRGIRFTGTTSRRE
jgi:hypothetical protein